MQIALDTMGGDHGPGEAVRGAAEAARRLGVEIVLVGRPDSIEPELAALGVPPIGLTVAPASDVIGMGETPTIAIRHKRDSSILVGLELLKRGRVQAFVSAGNTGAVMTAATLTLGRVKGIERPALATILPARGGRRVLLLDAGANADYRAGHLVQFALMGQAYARHALGISAPRVGVLSIGEERSKGNQLVQEAHEQLRQIKGLSFIGNVEGRDLPSGRVDVVVTDGFTGNVVLKTAEGTADFILHELRDAIMSRPWYKLAALVLQPAFKQLRQSLDYAEYGGAPLLGVRGVVIVAHGRSNSRAFASAIRVARDAAAAGIPSHLSALPPDEQA